MSTYGGYQSDSNKHSEKLIPYNMDFCYCMGESLAYMTHQLVFIHLSNLNNVSGFYDITDNVNMGELIHCPNSCSTNIIY